MHPEDFLSLDEWHGLLKAAQSAREAAILWLLGGAGLRVSEAAIVKEEHLDGPGGYLHVEVGRCTTACFTGSRSPLKWSGRDTWNDFKLPPRSYSDDLVQNQLATQLGSMALD